MNDQFELYDLKLVVTEIRGNCTCHMRVGDCVFVRGGKISLPDGADFCLYALQPAMPLLPAKQRRNHPADWMETDAFVTCADPSCGLIMQIERVGSRVLKHDEVSAIKLEGDGGEGTRDGDSRQEPGGRWQGAGSKGR